ncbi:MAG: YraN family protein [Methylotenera sp.]|nr:YraN family protein [Methylotenera sp.]
MKLNLLKQLPAKFQASHLEQGHLAEQIAATFLHQHGLILIEKNYRCKHGEIDLIMREGETLVFVEVRLRTNQDFGGAASSITHSKQQKLSRAAALYLQTHGDCNCRFDAILMQTTDLNAVEWIKNAF